VIRVTRRIWIGLGLCFVAFQAHTAETDYWTVRVSEVTSVYDADTFRVNIADWPAIIGERIPIRVHGIDAPEIKGQCEAEKRGTSGQAIHRGSLTPSPGD